MTNDAKKVLRRWHHGSLFGLRAVADLLGCNHRRARIIIARLIDSGWAMKVDRKRDLYRLTSQGCELARGINMAQNPPSVDKEAQDRIPRLPPGRGTLP